MNKRARIQISLTGGGRAAAEAGKVSKSLDTLRRRTLLADRSGRGAATSLSKLERAILSVDTTNGRLSRSLGLTSRAIGALRFAAVGTGAALAGGFAAAGRAGFAFNDTMDRQRISFETLLGSAGRAQSMMSDLLGLAERSPVLDPRATGEAATTLMSYGIAAKDVLPYVEALGNMSVVSGKSIAETLPLAARALGQIQGKGKLQAEELYQLVEGAGLNTQQLAKTLGVTQREFMENFKSGGEGLTADVALPAILKTMQRTGGRAADEYSKTFAGRMDQLQEQFAKAAGALVRPLQDRLTEDVLPAVTRGIDAALKGFQAGGLDGLFAGLDRGVGASGRVSAAWAQLRDIGRSLATIVREAFVPALTSVWDVLRRLPNPLGVVKDLLGVAAKNTRTLAVVLKVLIVGYVTYRTVALAVAAAQRLIILRQTLLRRTMIAAMLAQAAWMKASALSVLMLGKLRRGWLLLNIAIRLNPIMATVTAVIALGAAFVVAYKKIGWFRDGVDAVWAWIRDNWGSVLKWITGPIGLAVDAIISNWGSIKTATTSVVVWIKDRFAWVKDKLSAAFGIVARVGVAAFNLLKAPIRWIVEKVEWLLSKIPDIVGLAEDVGGFVGDAAGGVVDTIGGFLGRASGGPVTAGRTYLVGERGPELFTAPTMGRIVPTHGLSAAMPAAASFSGDAVVNLAVNLDGVRIADVVERVRLDRLARA